MSTNNNGNEGNRKKKRLPHRQVLWNHKCLELIDYKREFNHTNVPRRYTKNKPLGRWVATQRTEYKHFEDRKPSSLTKERIESLNTLGFVWRVGKGKCHLHGRSDYSS